MIRPTKENIDKYLGEGIYGRLPVLSAIYGSPSGCGDIFFIYPILCPICKITGYKYYDYMDDREYLIALDPQGLHIYYEDIEPKIRFIKFTEINKLYVKRGAFSSLTITIKTIDKRRYKFSDIALYPTDIPTDIPFQEKVSRFHNIQKETVEIFYQNLRPLQDIINSGKYRELHQ